MNMGQFLEKFGRTMFERPLASSPDPDEPPELAEIRLAILDQVREKSYRSGGRKVFPFDLLRVELRGVEQARAPVFTGQFFRKYLEQEVHGALRTAGCRFPDNLRVDVTARVGLPARDEPWLVVEAVSRGAGGGAGNGGARLVVHAGSANASRTRRSTSRASTSGAWWTSIARPACCAATTWRSWKKPKSIAPSHANLSRTHRA